MRKWTYIIATLLIVSCNGLSNKKQQTDTEKDSRHHHSEQEISETPEKKVLSPHTSAMAMIGDAHIHIDYSSPGVRGRIIFGGLLPYDEIWQAGAHMATWIETNKDLKVDGKILPAGKYGFFAIPSKTEWTLILNTNWQQHGKDEYDEKDDVLRFKVSPEFSKEVQEHLEYRITETADNKGTIYLAWEKVRVGFPFEIIQ